MQNAIDNIRRKIRNYLDYLLKMLHLPLTETSRLNFNKIGHFIINSDVCYCNSKFLK